MFVKCPSCAQSLPAGTDRCQFCGGAIATVAGAKSVWHEDGDLTPFERPRWVVPAYNAISVYFIVSALVSAAISFSGRNRGLDGPFVYVGPVLGIVLGVGLLARVEFIRGITNVLCSIRMLMGFLSLLTGAALTLLLGWIGLALLLINVLDIATNGFMIYLIGETD